MRQSIDRILRQLRSAFTVRDIMVDKAGLVRASSERDAQLLFEQYPEFDTIPCPSSGTITAYFRRGEREAKDIALFDLISDSTALVDLPGLFGSKEFFFVLSSDSVVGFVHFSDFNRSIMKVPFFILLEAVERHLWLQVSKKVNEESLSVALPDSRVGIITKRREKAQRKDVDLGWSGLFSFSEILQFSIHFDVVNINQDDLTLLANIRNRVAHADKLLVETIDDTDKLVKVHELCLEILDGV